VPAQHIREKLASVQSEIEAGRLWRAKEMLQGCIATEYALEPEILEVYGTILDSLGDKCEAGKYLFLSGQRAPGYAEAIEIYFERHRKTPVTDLIARFPARIRRHGLGHLPPVVREELDSRGASKEVLERREPLPYAVREPTWRDQAFLGGCLLVAALGVCLFLVGLFTIGGWVF
jgi:hypothetical protein